jgi:RimJ/RimL family protein N-acetyltransferase
MWTGKKVRLRALDREDLPLTHKWINTPEIVEYEGHPFPVSMAEENDWFESALKNENRKVLIVETLDEGRPIGYIYFDIDWRHRGVKLSITIGELAHQAKGYGTDALRTAVHHAFQELGLNRASASIFAFNQRSLRAFEKAGFRREGVARQCYLWHGAFQDQVMVSILREEYQSQCQPGR